MFQIIKSALRKPISVLVAVLGIVFFSVLSLFRIPVDIFPSLDLPRIFIVQTYGGMAADEMDAFVATKYRDHFLYVSGIKNVDIKTIQGLCLMRLDFYPGTDMAQAASEVANNVNRAKAYMPEGMQPPQVIRFDVSSVPVGQLVFQSKTRTLAELQEMASSRIRPMFSQIEGSSSPPPFGGNQRSIVIKIDPKLVRSYKLTPDEIIQAIIANNQPSPAGNIRLGDQAVMTPVNALIDKPEDFLNIPIRTGSGPTVFVRDVGTVEDAADITVSYALVNGRRAVYIPVVKKSDASTLDVVDAVKKELPKFQSALPDDVKISYEFDQSTYVTNALKSLVIEGALGAILTGLMVLLFLRDWRSVIIVVLTIPISLLSAVILLNLFGQTINIMTLSGLALAIGILVDQATVTIENIHQHLEMGKPKVIAIRDACKEIVFPEFLILISVLAVFAPSFIMSGVPKSMFLPLSLAVGFAMIASFLLSQTFVPVLANWLLKDHKPGEDHDAKKLGNSGEKPGWISAGSSGLTSTQTLALSTEKVETDPEKLLPASGEDAKTLGVSGEKVNNERQYQTGEISPAGRDDREKTLGANGKKPLFERFKDRYERVLINVTLRAKLWTTVYLLAAFAVIGLSFFLIGTDILPRGNSRQFQVRIKAPDGTRVERTEQATLEVLQAIEQEVGPENVEISSAFVGNVPSSYGTSNIFVFNSGPHEAVMQVAVAKAANVEMDVLKEKLRENLKQNAPELAISFEPMELVDKIMSLGSNTPVEVSIGARDIKEAAKFAQKIKKEMDEIPYLRDVQIAQPLNYPVLKVEIDRQRAGQLGVTSSEVAQSMVAATSSSRFTDKNIWLDRDKGLGYQVQVQIPINQMTNEEDLGAIPLQKEAMNPVLSDVATFHREEMPAQYDRSGANLLVTVSANLHDTDLGKASKEVQEAIKRAGDPPKGVTVELRGQAPLLDETLSSLQSGLLVAIAVIFLILTANFQSFRLSLLILSTVPAVVAGALLTLLLFGATLNLQSYMGLIMSVGVSVANAILLVTKAESMRLEMKDARKAAVASALNRVRPILMTSIAMIAGMMPMASGFGEGGDLIAPLGQAVIGGLFVSAFASLLILPAIFTLLQKNASLESVSLDPSDPESKYYEHSNLQKA